jgi:hypothetical protein
MPDWQGPVHYHNRNYNEKSSFGCLDADIG